MRRRVSWMPRLVLAAMGLLLAAGAFQLTQSLQVDRTLLADESPAPEMLDPAAWGDDHVGKELPLFMESGECLFCHRYDVGPTWSTTDRHAFSVRPVTENDAALEPLQRDETLAPVAGEVQMILGGGRHHRFLRRGEAYNHLDVHSVGAAQGRATRFRLTDTDQPHWDAELYGQSCAGCHSTAVDPQTQAFQFSALECFVCHGDADEAHSDDGSLMLLSPQRENEPRVVVSICAQCHARNGTSRSTGRPYPNQFVPGDNLFRDWQVDFAAADDPQLNPADRHILTNVRDVALLGREEVTCLSCHQLHKDSTEKHRDLAQSKYCYICHEEGQPMRVHKQYEVHSERCQY